MSEIVRIEIEGHRFYRRKEEPESHNRPSFSEINSYWVPPHLKRWFISKSASEIDLKSKSTAVTGSGGHSIVEELQAGKTPLKTPENEAFYDSFVSRWGELVTQYQIEPRKQEFMVISDTFGFGGQIDAEVLLTDNKGDRKPYLVDLKTGSTGSAGVQLGAYLLAYQETNKEPMGICCFQLHRDGRKPKAIFYHDPVFWQDQFVGMLPRWRSENYQSLKAMKWNWLETDFLTEYVNIKKGKV